MILINITMEAEVQKRFMRYLHYLKNKHASHFNVIIQKHAGNPHVVSV